MGKYFRKTKEEQKRINRHGKIERYDLPPEFADTDEVRNFWANNVNAERLRGKIVSDAERGSFRYFAQIEEQRFRSHRHLMPWIMGIPPQSKVLEIGCGIGLDSLQIAKIGHTLTAIDLTDVAVETARKRFDDLGMNATFKVGDAMALEFDDNTFDCVYSFGVLHHAPDTEKGINEAFRVLKPGGEARIMLYNRHSLNELVHRITGIPFEERDELCPVVRRYTVNEVMQLFNNFSSVQINRDFLFGEGYGVLFKFIPRWLYDTLSRYLGWHLMIIAKK
ncbi:MAG: methyltransferase domain-containing protein [Alteromonadaceae bacterium]|nr:methyltransferase domain-containing protein [Alteromonadaceae bacterium]